MNKAESIAIVTGGDDTFAMPMAVTLYSALANLERGRRVSLYIIDGGISERHRQKLIAALNVEHVDARIEWLKPDWTRLEGVPVAGAWLTQTTYFRLFVPELLPEECERALYLDSDLVVESDVGRLWEQDLRDVRACGAPNYFSPIVAWKKEALLMSTVFGLAPETPLCNAGVLLMNLKRWREEQLGPKALKLAREFSLPESDQDAINIVVDGQWGVLDARWNVQLSAVERYGRFLKTSLGITDQEVEQTCAELIRGSRILHFTWQIKPWHFACQEPSRLRFFHYLKKSQWFGDIQDDDELMKRTFREQPGFEPWMKKVSVAKQDLDRLIPIGDRFILVDDATWGSEAVAGWRTIPFPERDGRYWGVPSDDGAAIQEFERLRNTDVHFMVFAWAAFWWIDYFPRLLAHLRDRFPCVLKNERVVVFDLRSQLGGNR
jgi:lipopolysaccharide biosynthesis glycosyltransferase